MPKGPKPCMACNEPRLRVGKSEERGEISQAAERSCKETLFAAK